MSEPTDAYVKRHDLATAVQSAVDAAGLGADEPQQTQDSRADVERLARACAAEQVAASRRRLERAQREVSGRETGPLQQQKRPKSARPPSPPPSRQRQRKRLPPSSGELRAELEAATFRADNTERELSRAASQNADLRAKVKEMQGEAMMLRARADEAESLRVTNEALRAEQASFYASLTNVASLKVEDLLAAVKRMRIADRGGAAAVASQLPPAAAAGEAAAAGSFSSAELTAAALEISRERQAKRQQERLRRATLLLEHERQLREQQAQHEQQARTRAAAQKQRSKAGRGRGGVGRGGRGVPGGAEALQHWTQEDGLEGLAPYVADQHPKAGK